jgi:hypothetical protein
MGRDTTQNTPVLISIKAWREPSRPDWLTPVRPA